MDHENDIDIGQKLWELCESGNIPGVRQILSDPTLDNNARIVNHRYGEKMDTPLIISTRRGHAEIVRMLLEDNRTQVNQRNMIGGTAFCVAAAENHLDMIELFFEYLERRHIDVNVPTFEGATPIFFACQQACLEVLDFLLKFDEIVNLDQASEDATTPFFVACAEGHHEVVKRLLLSKRMNVNQCARDGTSPIWIAAQEDHMIVVKWILALGEHVDLTLAPNEPGFAWHGIGAYDWALTLERHEIANLLGNYQRNPSEVRIALKKELHILEMEASEVFALIVLYSDEYCQIKEIAPWSLIELQNAIRFFTISVKLPMELQMVIANRIFRLSRDLISPHEIEVALRAGVKAWSKK